MLIFGRFGGACVPLLYFGGYDELSINENLSQCKDFASQIGSKHQFAGCTGKYTFNAFYTTPTCLNPSLFIGLALHAMSLLSPEYTIGLVQDYYRITTG
jgi:hypothetical protein